MAKGSLSYVIGRGEDASIPISRDENTVSREHAELLVLNDSRLYLIDRGSANGTFMKKNSTWVPVKQSYVSMTDVVKFGEYEIAVSELLSMLPRSMNKLRPKRNPATGEIEWGV